MILALWLAVVVLTVASVLLFGALIEMFAQLKQLRRVFGFEDGMNSVELGEAVGRPASDFGLPVALDQLSGSVLLLFISDICATCRRLADGLRGGPARESLWVVVVHVSSRAEAFVEEFALYGERIVHDREQTIVNALGVTMTPVAVVVSNGVIERAQTVPSLHQLDIALDGLDEVERTRAGLAQH